MEIVQYCLSYGTLGRGGGTGQEDQTAARSIIISKSQELKLMFEN